MKDCIHSGRGRVSVGASADRAAILSLWNAHRGFDYAVRLQGKNVDYELVVSGVCGEEVVATGVLPTATTTSVTIRVPGSWGDNRLLLRARLVTGSTAEAVDVSATWRQVIPGVSPTTAPAV